MSSSDVVAVIGGLAVLGDGSVRRGYGEDRQLGVLKERGEPLKASPPTSTDAGPVVLTLGWGGRTALDVLASGVIVAKPSALEGQVAA